MLAWKGPGPHPHQRLQDMEQEQHPPLDAWPGSTEGQTPATEGTGDYAQNHRGSGTFRRKISEGGRQGGLHREDSRAWDLEGTCGPTAPQHVPAHYDHDAPRTEQGRAPRVPCGKGPSSSHACEHVTRRGMLR